ncbi:Hypothetical predicted protein [Mytilus galloprovincialis]|uniref:LRAT domain-containing protein n=1 Tax=Mytilus galloprovincialis TaxID=29158 RepID=A0A8B6C807_MYTGA|nr:Hypothetical predicted protein [Mytilus galloprovincialis]
MDTDIGQDVISRHAKEITHLQKGAHVKFEYLRPLHAHHAIVTDINTDNHTFDCIHFTSGFTDAISKGDIPKTSIKTETVEFGKEGSYKNVLVVEYKMGIALSTMKLNRFPNRVAIAIAKHFEKNPDACQSFNLLTYNCEHFVFSCTTGYAICLQQLEPMMRLVKTMRSKDFLVDIADCIQKSMEKNRVQVVEYKEGMNYFTLISSKVKINLN